jgi:hypothetical protein
MDATVAKAAIWIKLLQTDLEIDVAKQEGKTRVAKQVQFSTSYRGTHVKIKKPKNFGDAYINRKGYASINVQATCNAREVFTSADVSWPSSTWLQDLESF